MGADTIIALLGALGGGGGIGLLLTRAFTGAQKQWSAIHQAQAADLLETRKELREARDEISVIREQAHVDQRTLRDEIAAVRQQAAVEVTASKLSEQECHRKYEQLSSDMRVIQTKLAVIEARQEVKAT